MHSGVRRAKRGQHRIWDGEDGDIGAASALAADGTSVAPVAAYSVALKLRTAYAGAALRVRRAANNAEADVGFTAANKVDVAALSTFCGASDCYVARLYDQSGNLRDLAQANTANQIKIYDGASASLVGSGTSPVLSVSQAGKTVERADTLGLSGNPAFTIAYVGRFLGPTNVGADVLPIRVFGSSTAAGGQLSLGYAGPSASIST